MAMRLNIRSCEVMCRAPVVSEFARRSLAVHAHVCTHARGELFMHKQAKNKTARIEPHTYIP